MNAYDGPERRSRPRLGSKGVARWTSSHEHSPRHGITDGETTAFGFSTKSEAVMAAWIHNRVHGHDDRAER